LDKYGGVGCIPHFGLAFVRYTILDYYAR